MTMRLIAAASVLWGLALAAATASAPSGHGQAPAPRPLPPAALFDTSHNCMACHNSLSTSAGEDISIGTAWRATMMANSARDPYWHAAVRREVIDHPAAAADIEDECSICHMPMARTLSMSLGEKGRIFAHLPIRAVATPQSALAADGVSCTACHQITGQKLGTPESFTGGFVIDTGALAPRPIYGPFPVQAGQASIMHSATGFAPVESQHIRQSELCATCHTLYTHPLTPSGEVLGRFPEQVPYLEWQHSAYVRERSCQSCHMPVVQEPTRMSSVLGELREGVARHNFLGGNFFMLGMLNRYRTELGVEATPQELDAAVRQTLEHLRTDSASLTIASAERLNGRLVVDVAITNRAGHKLPTGYPSRRAWIHLAVKSREGRLLFESGAMTPEGRIVGNDNDDDELRFELHYRSITSRDQVQIYEAIMADRTGAVTTGLLKATTYVKDNRLLPRGFDKNRAHPDVAVYGAASQDPDFLAAGDRVRYEVDLTGADGPLVVEAELRFQPIAFRWARNLESYDAAETNRFTAFYRSMAASSSALLAAAREEVR